MTRYGKITEGAFEWAPINYVTPEGKTICNFYRKEKYLRQYGYLPVETTPCPNYDYELQEAVEIYRQEGDKIIQEWEIRPLEGGKNAAD